MNEQSELVNKGRPLPSFLIVVCVVMCCYVVIAVLCRIIVMCCTLLILIHFYLLSFVFISRCVNEIPDVNILNVLFSF